MKFVIGSRPVAVQVSRPTGHSYAGDASAGVTVESLTELQARIEALRAEINRVESHMRRAQTHRSAAEELFKKP